MCIYERQKPSSAGAGWHSVSSTILISTFTLIVLRIFPAALGQTPGPERFAKDPQTQLELWDAVDYLLRTDQAKKAVPYIDRFIKSKPDDLTFVTIRNRYGLESILRLNDDLITRSFAQPIVDGMINAVHNHVTQSERLTRFVTELTKSPTEQAYALRHLREAGPNAIPSLVQALKQLDSDSHARSLIVHNMGRLDRSVILPLASVLRSSEPTLAADAATALGMIGDQEAVPFLTFSAAFPQTSPLLRVSAQTAIARLTGRPFSAQLQSPVTVLIDTAWRYYRQQANFTCDPITFWDWDNRQKVPVNHQMSRVKAEGILALQFANQALLLEPKNDKAQVIRVSQTLEKAIEDEGTGSHVISNSTAINIAKSSDPSILVKVLKTAIADGKPDLAAVTISALGQTVEPTALNIADQTHPLVEALYNPNHQVQFAAAKALVSLAPRGFFPGSSQVISVLARFAIYQPLPTAIVIDGNPTRGSQLAGFLMDLGYNPVLAQAGAEGFLTAAKRSDVELMLISFDLFQRGWSFKDTLAKFQADSRTTVIPIFTYGPLNVQYRRPNLTRDYPKTSFIVQPSSSEMLRQQLKGLSISPNKSLRANYAQEAVILLAKIATERKGSLASDLTPAEPALALALRSTQTASSAAIALGRIPDPSAQRSLIDVVLDPSEEPVIRKQSAIELLHSIEQFGRLITADQEARLAAVSREETRLNIHTHLAQALRALSPELRFTPLKPYPSSSIGKFPIQARKPQAILRPGQTQVSP